MPQTPHHHSLIEVCGDVLDDLCFDIFAIDAFKLRRLLERLQGLVECGLVDRHHSIDVGWVSLTATTRHEAKVDGLLEAHSV